MIEKIQLTALLFFIVSWVFILVTKEEALSFTIKATVVSVWGLSGLVAFGLTLYKIWI